MSAILYTTRAERQIAEAEAKSKELGGYPYEAGMLRGALRNLAAEAQLASQPDQIARRISNSVDLTPEEAADLIDAITASLRRTCPDVGDDVLGALRYASEAVAELSEEEPGLAAFERRAA